MEPLENLELPVWVSAKNQLAEDIWEFILQGSTATALPPYTPGSHLVLKTPAGILNKYSLIDPCTDKAPQKYRIAIKLESDGTGGSRSLIEDSEVGDQLVVDAIDNAFELLYGYKDYIFIAGGIGITPVQCMIQELENRGIESYKLYYLISNRNDAAYVEELQKTIPSNRLLVHDKTRAGGERYDLWPLFEKPGRKYIYCCGPRSLMESVRDMTGHWPTNAVKFESFAGANLAAYENHAFDVQLSRTGSTIHVEETQTLLAALRAHGVDVRSSCESGTCGTCITPLVSGDVEHRDLYLDDASRENNIMVCVSRGRGSTIILDI